MKLVSGFAWRRIQEQRIRRAENFDFHHSLTARAPLSLKLTLLRGQVWMDNTAVRSTSLNRTHIHTEDTKRTLVV